MKRPNLRQLSFLIPILLMASSSPAALTCADLFTTPRPSNAQPSSTKFEFKEEETIESNLERFAQNYGVKLKGSPENRLPDHTTLFPEGFSGFSVSAPKEVAGGIEIEMRFGLKERTPRTQRVVTKPVFRSAFPYPEFLGENWKFEDQSFQFFNVGTRLLMKEADPAILLEAVEQARNENPGKNVVVPLNKRWSQAKVMLNERQDLASGKAVENYDERKPYLAGEDLLQLREHDFFSRDNNDFLMLTKDTGKSPLAMTQAELKENLAAMVRIARVTLTDPQIKQLIAGPASYAPSLPHAQRLNSKLKTILANFFAKLATNGKLRVAELSRWNRFQDFSPAVMDAFLLKMFESAKEPGGEIDLFLLECDTFTSRLFKRYGFKMLVKISEKESATDEFLMYMDTHSAEYKAITEALAARSRNVSRQRETRMVPQKNWSTLWPAQTQFQNLGGKAKAFDMAKMLNDVRANLRNQSSAPGIHPNRGAEILGKVLDAENPTGKHLTQTALRLSSAEREMLFKKVVVFSEDFQKLMSYLSAQAGSKEKLVIIGQNAELIAELLKSQFPDRKIEFAGPANEWRAGRDFDKVFLLNERALPVSEIAASLKTDGALVMVDHLRGLYDKPEAPVADQLAKFLESVIKNKAPVSELELGLALVLQKQLLTEELSSVLYEPDLFPRLEAAGFETNPHTGSFSLYGGKASNFRRRE